MPSSVWFTLAHTLTTFPILFPIHVEFSDPSISSKSMTRASISSLVGTSKGLSLLWIHVCLLCWITLSWIFNLVWICNGAFKLRAANLEAMSTQTEAENNNSQDPPVYYHHPHPQYAFTDVPCWDRDGPVKGLRLRTVMISNIPTSLRSEKALQEYFEHYMSRKVEKPSMGLTSSTPPSFLNKSFAFIFNRAKRLPAHLPANPLVPKQERDGDSEDGKERKGGRRKSGFRKSLVVPKIERVVVARKMTELASLLQRREDILVQLETAHIKLANKALLAVKAAIERKEANKPIAYTTSKSLEIARKRRSLAVDPELADTQELDAQAQMDLLVDVLRPFVEQFGTQRSLVLRLRKAISRTSRQAFHKLRIHGSIDSASPGSPVNPVTVPSSPADTTVWDALLSLPRSSLDAYQPLVNLSQLFRGKTVPSIDYYTAKLNLLTSLITDNRAKALDDYDAVSTAFVTFVDPADARRACKYLAVHPDDPLACLVTMAPMYQDIDWIRVMKSTYKGEVSLHCSAFVLFLSPFSSS
jgi:Cytosolic domain of 10TM putative phosphate transporter